MTTPGWGLTRSVLASMTPDQADEMARFGTRRAVEAGTVVIEEGAAVDALHLVLAGGCDVTVRNGRSDEHVATLGPGDAIGEMSLLTGDAASATVRALVATELLSFDRAALGDLLARFPVIERTLGSVVADRLSRVQRRRAGNDTRVVVVEDGPTTTPHLAALVASAAWHARRPVLALVAGGTMGAADVLARARPTTPAVGHVCAVDDAVLGAVGELADAAAGWAAAFVVLAAPGVDVPRSAATLGSLCSIGPLRADLDDIGRGLLPTSSAYGAVVGRAARRAIGRRVGVAFGAGSARGFAHAGVVDVLAARGIPIDAVAGTSIGAAAAGLVGMGKGGDEILHALEQAGRAVLVPTLARSSLMSMRRLTRLFESIVGDLRIEDLDIPTALVAADLDTREEIVMRTGILRTAVLASIAIAGVYPPQHVTGRRLIDGAYLDPVPVGVVSDIGADVVIGVKLAGGARTPAEIEAIPGRGRSPWTPQVILRSIDLLSSAVARGLPAEGTVLVTPSFSGGGGSLSDFRRGGERFRTEGRRATEAVLPALDALLPWTSPP